MPKKNDNYIVLNGQKVELSEELIAQIRQSLSVKSIQLCNVETAGTFKIGKYIFKVLEQKEGQTVAILNDLSRASEKFGDSNNYNGSNVDKICCEFGEKIEQLIGEENLIDFTLDLTSDDGLKDYGTVERKMALLTADLYRKYVHTIDVGRLEKYWWLATADSTATHGCTDWVKCVSPRGNINGSRCYGNINGVRPFCIFNSNIFVSK